MNYTILDADYIPAGDSNLIRRHLDLLDELHHADEACEEELAGRIRRARGYIRRTCRRGRSLDRERTAAIQRLLAGSLLFFGWAAAMALLVG